MKKIVLVYLAVLISLTGTSQGSLHVAEGRVFADSDGQPLTNVTVSALKSGTSVLTDGQGKFRIMLTVLPDSLMFSHAEYSTAWIGLDSPRVDMTINLNRLSTVLEEVLINTGYEEVNRKTATGAFSVIDNQLLNQQVGTNILSRISGVASGIDNMTNKTDNRRELGIAIRGLSTVRGPLDPLVVLDNFIYEGKLENINPSDVDNVTILKDAAATAIYGAKGGNGVIVITTKKGAFHEGTRIELNSTITRSQKPDIFKVPEISSSDYIDVEELLFQSGYFNNLISNRSRPALTPAVVVFHKRSQGLISAADSARQIDELKSIDSREQYDKYFFQSPLAQQYALNARGGSSKMAWLISGGYTKHIDNLAASFDKLNLRVNNSYKPIDKVVLSVGVHYTSSLSKSGKPLFGRLKASGRSVPYFKFMDEDGNALPVSTVLSSVYTDTAGGGRLHSWEYKPLIDYKHDRTSADLQEIIMNTSISYAVKKGIYLEVRYQYQNQLTTANRLADMESFSTRVLINRFTQIDGQGNIKYIVPAGSVLERSNSKTSSKNLRGQVNFSESFGKHSINGIIGSELREAVIEGNKFSTYGYNSDPLTAITVDFVNTYPDYVTGGYSSIVGYPSFSSINDRFVSLFSNLTYAYQSRYMLSGSLRRDGSNIFGVNINNKWKPLWSAGVAWEISKERKYRLIALPELKARFSYGYNGNVDRSLVALPVAQRTVDPRSRLPVARITTINNPSLKWEQVSQANIGIDFSFKNHIIIGSIDFYKKRATDLYGPTPYDYTAWGGQSNPQLIRNIANLSGHGVDAQLRIQSLRRKVSIASTLYFSYGINKTTAYFTPEAGRISTILGGGRSITPVIGKPLYSIAAYRWGGLDSTGNPIGFVNGEKSTDYTAIRNEGLTKGVDGNIIYKGSAVPTVFGSLINTVAIKGFSVAVNISYRLGYFFSRPTINYSQLISSGIGHADFAKRWRIPGDELKTNVPAFKYPLARMDERDQFYSSAEINVLRADNIRLQYVHLTYSLPRRAANKELKLFLNAADLGVLWRANKEKLDPDYPAIYAPVKSFSAGFNFNF